MHSATPRQSLIALAERLSALESAPPVGAHSRLAVLRRECGALEREPYREGAIYLTRLQHLAYRIAREECRRG